MSWCKPTEGNWEGGVERQKWARLHRKGALLPLVWICRTEEVDTSVFSAHISGGYVQKKLLFTKCWKGRNHLGRTAYCPLAFTLHSLMHVLSLWQILSFVWQTLRLQQRRKRGAVSAPSGLKDSKIHKMCASIFHITTVVNSMKVLSQHRNGKFGFIKEAKENLPKKVTNCSEIGRRSTVTQREGKARRCVW